MDVCFADKKNTKKKTSEVKAKQCTCNSSSDFVSACWCAHGTFAQKLLTDLFANYTSALRPVADTNNILNVTLQITLSQIIDMVTRQTLTPQREISCFV